MRVRRLLTLAAVAALTMGSLVAAGSPAGATTFGPVDHTLADGAPNSLRDIVTNLATTAGNCVPFPGFGCGDVVELEAGQTYLLTCAGGGPLSHGDTPIFIGTPGSSGAPTSASSPATIQQTCPGDPIFSLSAAGTRAFLLGNVHYTGGSALTTPPCSIAGPTMTRTVSTSNHTTTNHVDLPPRDAFVTRVVGVAPNGQTVFDQSTPNAPSSPQAQALFAAARTAVAAAPGTVAETGPTLIGSSDSSNTAHVADVLNFQSFSFTATTQVGPGVTLIGDDQSELYFLPPGCTNRDDGSVTLNFVDSQFQTTVTHASEFEIVGLATQPRFTG